MTLMRIFNFSKVSLRNHFHENNKATKKVNGKHGKALQSRKCFFLFLQDTKEYTK